MLTCCLSAANGWLVSRPTNSLALRSSLLLLLLLLLHGLAGQGVARQPSAPSYSRVHSYLDINDCKFCTLISRLRSEMLNLNAYLYTVLLWRRCGTVYSSGFVADVRYVRNRPGKRDASRTSSQNDSLEGART